MKPHWLSEEEIQKIGKRLTEIEVLERPWTELNAKAEEANPVMQYESGWYFWDETWGNVFGPFETEEDATRASMQYVKGL